MNIQIEAELVQIEVESSQPESRLAQAASATKFAGMWADDEMFDEFVAVMEEYRRSLDQDQN